MPFASSAPETGDWGALREALRHVRLFGARDGRLCRWRKALGLTLGLGRTHTKKPGERLPPGFDQSG